MNRSRWLVVVTMPLFGLVFACSSGGGNGSGLPSGSTGSSATGGSATKPHCYLHRTDLTCECLAKDDDDNHLAADWRKVEKCNEATVGSPISCSVDTKVNGETTSCYCSGFRCVVNNGRCSCGVNAQGEEVAACDEDEWYCGKTNKTECHGGNGNYGSACANEEENVTTCSMAKVVRAEDDEKSCDGLRFVQPPPPPPSSGSGSGSGSCSGCSSDSDCHDKCKRCDRSTCSCVSRITC